MCVRTYVQHLDRVVILPPSPKKQTPKKPILIRVNVQKRISSNFDEEIPLIREMVMKAD